MLRFISFVLLLIILSSCYNERKSTLVPPDPLLTEEQLLNVLTDMQLAEAIINYDRLQKITNKGDFKDTIYSVILQHYSISAEQLNDNLDYYNNDPENMERLYEEVLSNLSTLQSEIQIEASINDTLIEESKE